MGRKMSNDVVNWRDSGVRIVRSDQLDMNTPQTPGMTRAAAINRATAGANKLWAGTVNIQPNAKTGAHHHGALESVIYVVMDAHVCGGASNLNLSQRQDLAISSMYRPSCHTKKLTLAPMHPSPAFWCGVTKPIVINLDIEPVEPPEEVYWVDPIHPEP